MFQLSSNFKEVLISRADHQRHSTEDSVIGCRPADWKREGGLRGLTYDRRPNLFGLASKASRWNTCGLFNGGPLLTLVCC